MTGIETKTLAIDVMRRAKSIQRFNRQTSSIPSWDEVDTATAIARQAWHGMGVYLADLGETTLSVDALDVIDLAAALAIHGIDAGTKVARRTI